LATSQQQRSGYAKLVQQSGAAEKSSKKTAAAANKSSETSFFKVREKDVLKAEFQQKRDQRKKHAAEEHKLSSESLFTRDQDGNTITVEDDGLSFDDIITKAKEEELQQKQQGSTGEKTPKKQKRRDNASKIKEQAKNNNEETTTTITKEPIETTTTTTPSEAAEVIPTAAAAAAAEKPSVGVYGMGLMNIEDIVSILQDHKAQDMVVINCKGKCNFVEHMVFVTGQTMRHMKMLCSVIISELRARYPNGNFSIEGEKCDDWMLVDAHNVIVHAFSAEGRVKYDLERKWAFQRNVTTEDGVDVSTSFEDDLDGTLPFANGGNPREKKDKNPKKPRHFQKNKKRVW